MSNALSAWFLLWPLTSQERKTQWIKYKCLGKLNYSLSFLDLEEDYKEWNEYQKKTIKPDASTALPAASGHH